MRTIGVICRLLSSLNTLVAMIALFIVTRDSSEFFNERFWKVITYYFCGQGILLVAVVLSCLGFIVRDYISYRKFKNVVKKIEEAN